MWPEKLRTELQDVVTRYARSGISSIELIQGLHLFMDDIKTLSQTALNELEKDHTHDPLDWDWS